jgi:hypothetical protein
VQNELSSDIASSIDGLVKQLDGLVTGYESDPSGTLESLERQFVAAISQTEQGIIAQIQAASSDPDGGFLESLTQWIQ